MITIDIEFAEDLPVERRKTYAQEIAENFPYHYVDHNTALSTDDVSGVRLFIQLSQDDMTDEQERFLNKFEYIREYNPRPVAIVTPALEPWQAEAIHDILNISVNKVPSNGNHTRYYTEAVAEQQWDNEHHLIDVGGKDPMYSDLTITQCSTSEPSRSVKLNYNEVDELLTILLQWRMNAARASHEAMTKVEDDGINVGDDHPF